MSYVPPPPPAASAPVMGSVPNHLAWAIVATIFSLCLCCGIPGLITGIIAIVFAAQVNGKLNAGDIEGARRASNTAKILCWVTTACAAIGLLLTIYAFTMGDGIAGYQQVMEQIQSAQ
ncbi:MAG: CD225/dispanin family protein [Pseudoxanthomonas sp.]